MNLLEKFGVDTKALAEQAIKQEEVRKSRTLLLDGDALCYRVTANCKKLDTALRRYEQGVLEIMYLVSAGDARVHITPRGCSKNSRGELNTVLSYQGNRKNRPKPVLLTPLRDALSEYFEDHRYIRILQDYALEADDTLMQDAFIFKDKGVLVSEDKDLNINPYRDFDLNNGLFREPLENKFGFIVRSETSSGKPKIVGKGTKFFWWQMLAGDKADNVRGLSKYNGKLMGDIAAYNLCIDEKDEVALATKILNMYSEVNQNPLTEGHALWLIRWEGDCFENYLKELGITIQDSWVQQKWRVYD